MIRDPATTELEHERSCELLVGLDDGVGEVLGLGGVVVNFHAVAGGVVDERYQQGLGNRLIEPTIAANNGGTIQCRERLGGLLRFYHRDAA